MRTSAKGRLAVAIVAVLALVATACGDDSADETTPTTRATTTTTIAATTTTVPAFDLAEVVHTYASTIPDGFRAVGDITAFKDAMTAGAFVIDVRQPDEYAEGHIAGAINIPLRELGDNLNKIPTDRQVFVYCASGHRAGIALSSLGVLGYDNVLSFPPSYKGWIAAEEPVTTDVPSAETYTVPAIETELLDAVNGFLTTIPEGWLSAGDVEKVTTAMDAGAFMLDVRGASEFDEGHIPGAVNIPLREIAARFDELPSDVQLISYCKSGHRQAMSLPLLHLLGNETAKGFPASWLGWTAANQPVETA